MWNDLTEEIVSAKTVSSLKNVANVLDNHLFSNYLILMGYTYS